MVTEEALAVVARSRAKSAETEDARYLIGQSFPRR
jgi:hypothetical protein